MTQPSPEEDSSGSSISLSDEEEGGDKNDEDPGALLKEYLDYKSSKFIPLFTLKGGGGGGQEFQKNPEYEKAPTFLNLKKFEQLIPNPRASPSEKEIASSALKPNIPVASSSGSAIGGGGGVPGRSREAVKNKNLEKVQGKSSSAPFSLPTPAPSSSIPPGNDQKEPHYPIPGRKFLPHQMPVYRPPKLQPNFKTIMQGIQGPLGRLRYAVVMEKRIKIWTRHESGFRGFTTGFLIAFDKHWNLALRDVDEVIQRKRKTKAPISTPSLISAKNESTKKQQSKSSRSSQSLSPRRAHEREHGGRSHSIDSRHREHGDNQRGGRSSRSSSAAQKKLAPSQSRPSSNFLLESDALQTIRFAFEGMSLKIPKDGEERGRESRNLKPRSREVSGRRRGESPPFNRDRDRDRSHSTNKRRDSSSTTRINPERSDCKTPKVLSKSQIKKKGLIVFQKPYLDANGYKIVGHSKKYELAERHTPQQIIFGDSIILIEIQEFSQSRS